MSASWSSSASPREFPTLTAREAAPPPSHRLIGVNQYRRGTHRRHTYLQAAFDVLRHRGAAMPTELIRHVAPLGWEHIGLTGDYVWSADPMPANGLRPLRRSASLLAA